MTSPEDKKKMEIRTNNGSKVIRWVIIIAVAAAVGFGAKVMLAPKPQAQQQAPAAPVPANEGVENPLEENPLFQFPYTG